MCKASYSLEHEHFPERNTLDFDDFQNECSCKLNILIKQQLKMIDE